MSASQFLSGLFNAGVAISIIATVLSLGMSFTLAEVLAPLRRVWLVLAMVILNAGVIPALAWGIAWLFPLSGPTAAGLTLATLGAGTAAGLKAAQLSTRADLPLAVALVVVLQVVNIVAVPLWAGRVISGASLSPLEIVKNLLALVLIPLLAGLLIRGRAARFATRWQPELVRLANLALAVALVSGLIVNWMAIVSLLGSWALLAILVIILLAGGLGALVGWRDRPTRTTTGLISGMRFGSLGLIIIGTQLGGNPAYLGPAICFALLDLLVPLAVAIQRGRRTGAAANPSLASEAG